MCPIIQSFYSSVLICGIPFVPVALFVCLYCIVLCCIFCVSTLRVTLPSQIPCLCKLTWPIKPDSENLILNSDCFSPCYVQTPARTTTPSPRRCRPACPGLSSLASPPAWCSSWARSSFGFASLKSSVPLAPSSQTRPCPTRIAHLLLVNGVRVRRLPATRNIWVRLIPRGSWPSSSSFSCPKGAHPKSTQRSTQTSTHTHTHAQR